MTYQEQALPEADDRELQDYALFNLFVKESGLINENEKEITHECNNTQ